MRLEPIEKLVNYQKGENNKLHLEYVNPQFAKTLKYIGFDRSYTKAKGQYLFDTENRRYLDFICGYGVFNIGRNHPKMKERLKEYIDQDPSNLVKMECPYLSGLLAKELVALTPENLDIVYFASGGAEAVETAIKFARCATHKSKVIYCKGAFHGLTLGALSVNGDKSFRDGFEPFLPDCESVKFNDLLNLEEKLSKKDAACFIVEPIQGKGVHIPSDDYLIEAQRLCKKYGALFILDEVQTAFGRTGKMFALEHWNLEPDILTISKALSGGYVPVSACLMNKKIFLSVFSSLDRCVVHSSTFGQNNLAMLCGLTTLEILKEEKIIENSEAMGNLLLNGLQNLIGKYDFIKEVRGKGLMIGIEFGSPKSIKLKIGWNLLEKVNKGLFCQSIIIPLLDKYGILTQVGGHHVDILKLLPVLTINEDDVNYFLTSFEATLASTHKFPGAIWEIGSTLAKLALKKEETNVGG